MKKKIIFGVSLLLVGSRAIAGGGGDKDEMALVLKQQENEIKIAKLRLVDLELSLFKRKWDDSDKGCVEFAKKMNKLGRPFEIKSSADIPKRILSVEMRALPKLEKMRDFPEMRGMREFLRRQEEREKERKNSIMGFLKKEIKGTTNAVSQVAFNKDFW